MKEEQTIFLMIGGPVDGELYAIPPDAKRYAIPILDPLEIKRFKYSDQPLESVKYSEHIYHKLPIINKGNCNSFYVFVHNDLMVDEICSPFELVLRKLVNHYHIIK